MSCALLFLLLACARAQDAQPQAQPAASTDTAVASSTGTVDLSSGAATAPEAVGHGLKRGGEQPTAVLANPIAVHVHKESKDWEPVSFRVGGDPGQAATTFTRRIKRRWVKGKAELHGEASKAKAVARLHPRKDDKLLIISVYPAALKPLRAHLEVRLLISEGWLEEAKVAAVTVHKGERFVWGADDSYTLERKGVEYREDFPDQGKILAAALDPKPGKKAVNGGAVKGADFGGAAYGKPDLGLVNFGWNTTGVAPDKKRW